MFRSGAQLMLFVLLVGLFLMRESRQEPAIAVEEGFADFLSVNCRRAEEPAPITTVAIDANSMEEHSWPWTPLDFALFFQSANTFRPAVLATDEIFRWDPKTFSPEQAQKLPQYGMILRDHLLQAPKVLLGGRLGFPDDPQALPPLEEVPIFRHVRGNVSGIPEFTVVESQSEDDFRLSSSVGFTNLTPIDPTHRTVPLVLRYRGEIVPSFVLQAVLLWEKVTPDEVVVEPGSSVTLADRLVIPIDQYGQLRIDSGVPRGHCTFDELVLASAQIEAGQTPILNSDLLSRKLLFLTRTDPASKTLPLASNRKVSQGELFAAAIATIQNRNFIRRVPVWFDWLVIVVMMLLSSRVLAWSRTATWGILLVCLIGYVMIAMQTFPSTLTWPPLVLPAGLVWFIGMFRLAIPKRKK